MMKSLIILLVAISCAISSQKVVTPKAYNVYHAVSFDGSNLTSTSKGCSQADTFLNCSQPNIAKLTDGDIGPLNSFSNSLGEFFAFSRQFINSGIIEFTLPQDSSPVSNIVLYFFNSPNKAIGLPEISISGLIVENSIVVFKNGFDYFFINNDHLSQTDSQLRNVTLHLQQFAVHLLQLQFTFPSESVINRLLLSEVQLYNGTQISPSMNTIVFHDDNISTVTLVPENIQSSITLSCTVINSGSFVWQWMFNGDTVVSSIHSQVLIKDATRSSSLAINNPGPSDIGNYTCSVRYSTGNISYYRHLDLLLGNKSTLTTPQSTLLGSIGQSLNIRCELSGYLVSTVIQWKQNNKTLLTSNQYTINTFNGTNTAVINGVIIQSIVSQLTIISLNNDVIGTYMCTVPGTELMESVIVSVGISVTIRSFQPEYILGNSTNQLATNVSLRCIIDGPVYEVDIRWRRDSGIYNSSSESGRHTFVVGTGFKDEYNFTLLLINSLSYQDSGTYYCEVRPSSNSEFIWITASVNLLLLIHLIPGDSITFNGNETHIELSCDMAGYIPPDNDLRWYRNNILISNGTKYTTFYRRGNYLAQRGNNVSSESVLSILSILSPTISDTGPYECRVYNISSTVHFRETESSIVWQTVSITVAVSVVICVVLVLVIVLVVIVWKKKWQHKLRLTDKNQNPFTTNVSSPSTYIPLNAYNKHMEQLLSSEHIISVQQLQLLETIGNGEFGVVYRGLLIVSDNNTSQPVAVKTLKEMSSESDIDKFNQEALKMTYFEHRNVLSLIGVCIDSGPSPYIVMPFMSKGSLLSFLKNERHNLVLAESVDEDIVLNTRKQLLSMCLQVADGMKYLAEQQFIHRDLAARNCMIDSNGVIKVSDFGLTEEIYSKNYYRQTKEGTSSVKLPIKWMALESIVDGIFNEKTDVWSYGVLCWEVFSGGKIPYPGLDPQSVVELLDSEGRLKIPSNGACSDEIYTLMMSCWKRSPDERPTFTELFQSVNDLIKPLAGYIELNIV